VASPVKVESGFAVQFSTRVLERIRQRAAGRSLVSERVERIRLRQCSRYIRKRRDGVQSIPFVVTRRARPQHGQRFIDVQSLRIPGLHSAGSIRFLMRLEPSPSYAYIEVVE